MKSCVTRKGEMSSLQPPEGLVRSTSGRKRHLKRTDKKRSNVVSTDTVKEQQVGSAYYFSTSEHLLCGLSGEIILVHVSSSFSNG